MAQTEEIRGIGHRVRRVEDDRFIRGKGTYVDDVKLPGHAPHGDPAQPLRARRHQGHRHVRAARPIPASWPS
ncbi:MAG: hypothetical protein KatS3mg014_0538 [Actinomycetota bacterium]|nr:MAG: hypothetical protein KatS3mg014_0538 [Actinomycetota bacterium]